MRVGNKYTTIVASIGLLSLIGYANYKLYDLYTKKNERVHKVKLDLAAVFAKLSHFKNKIDDISDDELVEKLAQGDSVDIASLETFHIILSAQQVPDYELKKIASKILDINVNYVSFYDSLSDARIQTRLCELLQYQ